MKLRTRRTVFARRAVIASGALLGTALTPLAAFAQDATWNGPGTNFSAGANWSTNAVPTNRALFANTGPTGIQVLQPNTLNQLQFGPTAPAYVITNMGSGFTLNGISGVGIDNLSSSVIDTIINRRTMTLNNASTQGNIQLINAATSGNDALLTLNGTTQLGTGTTLLSAGQGGFTITNGTLIGSNTAIIFNDTSGADGINIQNGGGSATAIGNGINNTFAFGGDGIMTFNDASHADNATFNFSAGSATATSVNVIAQAGGGDSEIHFLDTSHADGATFAGGAGLTNATGGPDGFGASATAATAQLTFEGSAHADNATFNYAGGGTIGFGGTGRPGAGGGTGADGGLGVANGGLMFLSFAGDSHSNNSTFTNVAGTGNGVGGDGGSGGTTGNGGIGGRGQTLSTAVLIQIADNAHVDNAVFNNTAGAGGALGGTGGTGGPLGNGGTGGIGSAVGGTIRIAVIGNASVAGATFNNRAGDAVANGGNGGNGGTDGDGGTGGQAIATGGLMELDFGDNVTLTAGTTINNRAGDAFATGGNGGPGGPGAPGGNGGDGGSANAIAGSATVTFSGNSSAGGAHIVNSGGVIAARGGNGGNGASGDGGDGGFARAEEGDALIAFTGSSTAGAATIENHRDLDFTSTFGTTGTNGGTGSGGFNGTTAGIFHTPEIRFSGNATGGSAQILNDLGDVNFLDNSVFGTAAAGGAHLDNQGGFVFFFNASSLGNASLNNSGSIGGTFFADSTSAGSGTITNDGTLAFIQNSTAGSATITNNIGGALTFNGSSDAVGARIVNNGGQVDVGVNGLRIGSLSGSGGDVRTNGLAVQIGALNLADTYAGIISGTGSVTKVGTGTLTLTGTNTYSGGTMVNAGTLQLGNGGTTGSVVGDITDNANVTFNRSDNVTFANIVSGSGSLTKAGAGTLILTNANTYAGGTTIDAGTLQIGNDGATGSITGNVVDNANLAFNRTGTVTFAGNISGSGTLTKNATGTVILTGASTYGGGTTINTGSLQIGDGGTTGSIAGNVSIAGVAALAFDRSDNLSFSGNISGAGQLFKLAAGILTLTGNVTLTGNTIVTDGALQIGNGGTTGSISGNIIDNANVTFNRSDTLTYGGVISGLGGSVVKNGAGTLILTGANTYSGGTFVSAGTLQLDGSVASPVQVLGAGRLTGTGTVNSGVATVGTIAPGSTASPFGTLTATGVAIFNAGSFLQPTINSAGQSSLLSAGTLTINGGQVRPNAVAGGLFLMQTDYRIANATTTRTGTFTGVDESQLPGFVDASLFYAGNDVFLRVKRNATNFAQATDLTPNQLALSSALDAAVAANNPAAFTTYLTTYNVLLPLSGSQLQGALNIESGDALTAIPVAAQGQADRFADRLASYTWSNSSNLWGLIAYGDQHADSDGNGPGFKSNGLEAQMGFNTSLGHDTRLGLSVGYNDGDVGIGQRLASADIESWSVGARLRHDFGQIYAAGQFTYSWHNIDSTRTLFLPGTANASYDAQTWTAGGELGWAVRSGQLSIEPHLSIRHASTSTDAYSESGPVGALDVAAADYETTRLGIGIRLANRTVEAPVKFYAMLRYERETGDNNAVLDNNLPGLPTFQVVSTRLGDNILSGEVGAEFRLSNGVSLFAAGGGHTRSNETSLQGNAGLRVRF